MLWDDWCFEDLWESLNRSYNDGDAYAYQPSYYRRQTCQKDKESIKLAKTLKRLLKEKGIEVFDLHQAASGSCYLQFEDRRLGQCRIGNHKEKRNLGYRWQVRSDIDEKYVEKNKGHNQFIYPIDDLEGLATHLYNYWKKISEQEEVF